MLVVGKLILAQNLKMRENDWQHLILRDINAFIPHTHIKTIT